MCLLYVLGVRCAFVTAAVNPEHPREFSHVYLAAYLPTGERIPLDFSHGPAPGWQCIDEIPYPVRVREWPLDETGYGFEGFLATAAAIAVLIGGCYALSKGLRFS